MERLFDDGHAVVVVDVTDSAAGWLWPRVDAGIGRIVAEDAGEAAVAVRATAEASDLALLVG